MQHNNHSLFADSAKYAPKTNHILSEYKLNDVLTLKNRIVMAPMTRAKADDTLVPTEDMAKYYSKRSDAGLIITEGTVISRTAIGHKNVAGIFNDSQVAAWKKVTDAVHENNGLIFSQIWHVGRVSHPNLLNGELPISSSETLMTGNIPRSNGLTFGKSRTATTSEIKTLVSQFSLAAVNARRAGFDGVEIHGANGYLIDQFLHHHTNLRTDEYGCTPENMARFALEVIMACGDAIGYQRVGLRLSPGGYLNEIIGDKKDREVFIYLLEKLNLLQIAYVHTGNFDDTKIFAELDGMTMTQFIRKHYKGTVIAAGGYTPESADAGIEKNHFSLVAMGRPFIANPDLVLRIRNNEALNSYDSSMLNKLI